MINSEIKTIEVPQEEKEVSQKKKSRKGKFFIFLILIAALGYFGYLKYQSLNEIYAIKEHLSFLKENKIKTAYDATSKEFKEETSLETFNTFVEQHPSLKKNEGFSFDEKIKKENIIILKGSLTSKDNHTTKIQYKIIKENNKWKIHGIEIFPSED